MVFLTIWYYLPILLPLWGEKITLSSISASSKKLDPANEDFYIALTNMELFLRFFFRISVWGCFRNCFFIMSFREGEYLCLSPVFSRISSSISAKFSLAVLCRTYFLGYFTLSWRSSSSPTEYRRGIVESVSPLPLSVDPLGSLRSLFFWSLWAPVPVLSMVESLEFEAENSYYLGVFLAS
jgi:hypothetical protein